MVSRAGHAGTNWGLAYNIQSGLQEGYPRLHITVAPVELADYKLTAYNIKAVALRTRQVVLQRILTTEEIENEAEYNLLMSQLWLVQPQPYLPPTLPHIKET